MIERDFEEVLNFKLDEMAADYSSRDKPFNRGAMRRKIEADWRKSDREYKETKIRLFKFRQSAREQAQKRQAKQDREALIEAYERPHLIGCNCEIEKNEPCLAITSEMRLSRGEARLAYIERLQWLEPKEWLKRIGGNGLRIAADLERRFAGIVEELQEMAFRETEKGMIHGRFNEREATANINSRYFQRRWRDCFLALIRRENQKREVA